MKAVAFSALLATAESYKVKHKESWITSRIGDILAPRDNAVSQKFNEAVAPALSHVFHAAEVAGGSALMYGGAAAALYGAEKVSDLHDIDIKVALPSNAPCLKGADSNKDKVLSCLLSPLQKLVTSLDGAGFPLRNSTMPARTYGVCVGPKSLPCALEWHNMDMNTYDVQNFPVAKPQPAFNAKTGGKLVVFSIAKRMVIDFSVAIEEPKGVAALKTCVATHANNPSQTSPVIAPDQLLLHVFFSAVKHSCIGDNHWRQEKATVRARNACKNVELLGLAQDSMGSDLVARACASLKEITCDSSILQDLYSALKDCGINYYNGETPQDKDGPALPIKVFSYMGAKPKRRMQVDPYGDPYGSTTTPGDGNTTSVELHIAVALDSFVEEADETNILSAFCDIVEAELQNEAECEYERDANDVGTYHFKAIVVELDSDARDAIQEAFVGHDTMIAANGGNELSEDALVINVQVTEIVEEILDITEEIVDPTEDDTTTTTEEPEENPQTTQTTEKPLNDIDLDMVLDSSSASTLLAALIPLVASHFL